MAKKDKERNMMAEETLSNVIIKTFETVSSTEVIVAISIVISVIITKIHELAIGKGDFITEDGKLKKFKYFSAILYNIMTGFLFGIGTFYAGVDYAPQLDIKIVAIVSIFIASIGEPIADVIKEILLKSLEKILTVIVKKLGA